MSPADADVAIVGAGAAGLATAIFTAARAPRLRIHLLDGARQPGAKILVSGGSRCNVTNTIVTEADFSGGRQSIIRSVLRAFPAAAAADFFRGLGVPLHEEPGGKLFPDSNRSRDVLEALLREAGRTGVVLRTAHRVHDVTHEAHRFHLGTSAGSIRARAVVLATGGLSLPKTGSDGKGYDLAQHFGHSLIPTTPALAPLLLDPSGGRSWHQRLSGVSQDVRLDVRVDGQIAVRITGAMLWTHFGVSGPAPLDASRHWLRARLDGRAAEITAALIPDRSFDAVERALVDQARAHPKSTAQNALAARLPSAVAAALLHRVEVPERRTLAELTRDERRRVTHALVAWPLPITDSRGYNYAEVTAGGVDLSEVNPGTMESRRQPGLFLVGEMLDVDGRLGGFNFQWAWSSATAASLGLARLA